MSDFKLVKLLDGLNISIDANGLLNKYDATVDPTVTDDSVAGYAVGSHWVNTTSDAVFICADSSAGAAVWQNVSASGTDISVKVSANDTTTGFLEDKIVAGTNITLTTLNDGANETLEISAAGGGGGSGDVVGPAGATDNSLPRYDTATGKLIQDSGIIVDDSNNMTGVNDISPTGTVDGRDVAADGTAQDTHIANITTNPHAVDQTDVGLGNVDNTSDADKPVSTATQTALDLKYDASNPDSFLNETSHDALPSDNPHSVTQTQVGLGNVDNTSDVNKPISTATQTALDLKADETDLTTHTGDADIHIDHTAVDIIAGDGLAGGGDISTSRTLNVNITNESSIPLVSADEILVYDVSGSVIGKTTAQSIADLGGGSGDVVGPAGATDNSIARYETATGKLIQDSGVIVDDSDNVSGVNDLSTTGTVDLSPTAAITNSPYAFIVDQAGTNLVPNAIFEANITDGWSDTGTVTSARTTSEQWIGSASLSLTSSTVNSGVVSDPIPVSASTQYIYTCYVKGDAGGEGIFLTSTPDVSPATSNINAGLLAFTFNDPINTEWSRITHHFTTGVSDTTVALSIRSMTSLAQTAFIDAVQLEAKNFPDDVLEVPVGSSFIHGSMGEGYEFTGAANNSSSTRTAGVKSLAPFTGNNRGNFVVRTDGTIARAIFDAKEVQYGEPAGDRVEPFFPFQIKGNMKTNVGQSGVLAGIMNITNQGNGAAVSVESSATTASGLILSVPDLTTGDGLAIFAPADLSAFTGSFLTFSGKGSNLEMYQFKRDEAIVGNLGFTFDKDFIIYGGGNQSDSTRVLAGTVNVTNGSATVTGTNFLTDFKRGMGIRINNGGVTVVDYTILSIESDTSLTLSANYSGTTNAARAYDGFTLQYSPPLLSLEGPYAAHGNTGGTGDYVYGIYASGGSGHLRVLKSMALGIPDTPTADNEGDGIVTSKVIETSTVSIVASGAETEVISGYISMANELMSGTCLRTDFVGDMNTLAATTTCIWRVKLGGVTILTSNTQQVGSTNDIDFEGSVRIIGTSETTQKVSLKVIGKDTSVSADNTYGVFEYSTSSIDMRLDQELTVTADFSDGSSMNIYFNTTEIL